MNGQPDRIAVEDLTEEMIARYTADGYTLAFTEDVMRRDLVEQGNAGDLPEATLPSGVTLATWDAATAPAFFAAYNASFSDRPGFPGWPEERWVEWTAGDPDFCPDLSWVALASAGADGAVGFITCGLETSSEAPLGFIIQVGTRPDWRGRGLASALMVRALQGFRADGRPAVLLDVNTNNPGARRLYERRGFTPLRRRGVFTRGG